MANHPYNQHREQQVAHRRVATILNGSPSGATRHASGHAFSKITSKTAAASDDDIAGRSSPKKYARGGKVGKKGDSKTTVNVIAGAPSKPPILPPIIPPPGGPPMGGPGLPPGGPPMPPMAGPGGPPPMPMRAAGGRVGKKRGGAIDAGALTGVGRLEKAARAK